MCSHEWWSAWISSYLSEINCCILNFHSEILWDVGMCWSRAAKLPITGACTWSDLRIWCQAISAALEEIWPWSPTSQQIFYVQKQLQSLRSLRARFHGNTRPPVTVRPRQQPIFFGLRILTTFYFPVPKWDFVIRGKQLVALSKICSTQLLSTGSDFQL